MKKIIYYGKFHINSPNGTYTAIWHLARAMANKTKVSIISPDNTYTQKEINEALDHGISLKSLKHNKISSYYTFFKELYTQRKITIVHFQYVRYPSQLLIAIWCRIIGIPCMISLHDGYSSSYFSTKVLKKTLYFILIDIWLIKLCQKIHFISEREKKDFRKIFPFTIESEIIKNCFIIENLPSYVKDSKALPVEKSSLKVCYIGRIDIKHKNLLYQIRLIKAILEVRDDIRFEIYGIGREVDTDKIKKEIQECSAISYNGAVYGDEKFAVLHDCDIFLHPSNWELFGYSILEAMQFGAHAVVKESADILTYDTARECISALTGDLFKDRKIMLGLCEKVKIENRQQRIAKNCAFIDRHCSIEVISTQMVKLYC